jgi:hypothetical protein
METKTNKIDNRSLQNRIDKNRDEIDRWLNGNYP